MKEITLFIQQNHSWFIIGGSIIVVLLTIYAFRLDKRWKQEARLIGLVDNLFANLCDPRISSMSYILDAKNKKIEINKSMLQEKGKDVSPMLYGKYQMSFAWFTPGPKDNGTRIIVELWKNQRGDVVTIYEKVATLR